MLFDIWTLEKFDWEAPDPEREACNWKTSRERDRSSSAFKKRKAKNRAKAKAARKARKANR